MPYCPYDYHDSIVIDIELTTSNDCSMLYPWLNFSYVSPIYSDHFFF